LEISFESSERSKELFDLSNILFFDLRVEVGVIILKFLIVLLFLKLLMTYDLSSSKCSSLLYKQLVKLTISLLLSKILDFISGLSFYFNFFLVTLTIPLNKFSDSLFTLEFLLFCSLSLFSE
jgi:hypothetical protein